MRFRKAWSPVVLSLLMFPSLCSQAQGPRPRLAAAIDSNGERSPLPGSRPGAAAFGVDQGAVPASTQIKGITLVFNRSAAQQAELEALLAAQGNPSSPQYHQWLTPDQFAAKFGVADADVASVKAWLTRQGFQVQGVARSRDRIAFDGTAGQVSAAFGTELHNYGFEGKTHFAPNSDLSLPATLAPMVADVVRLSSFHPRRQTKLSPAAVKPAYTSAATGNHFLTPSDLATMYDLGSTYQAGFNGAGQGIAVLGQSYITSAPIAAFQSGAGLTTNLPIMVLVPNTGVAGVNIQEDGDEGESHLDVEYSSGMAPGAKVYFVYTGDDANTGGVFDSLAYAVAENIAPVISNSYGECELTVAQADMNVIRQEVQQANAQGQTVISSVGDSGSTDCYGFTNLTATQQQALVADFPGSVPEVTGIGGLQMAAGTFTASMSSTQYWQGATGTDAISSLLSYVPEVVWNEDSPTGISSGGGGASLLYARPSWQAGVAGIPAGTQRLLPDISLQASTGSPGYIYCTSDPSDLAAEGVSTSCSNGLRGPSNLFQVAGGTSFGAPIFAGMLAVLNQAKHATGQGNANQTLYGLAANSGTYSSAFHDVTSGSNACLAGPTLCSAIGASLYSATAGYDEATGLGSVDFGKLVAAWPSGSAASLAASATTVQPASLTTTPAATQQVAISVAPVSGSGVPPTGTVAVSASVGGVTQTTNLTLSNGSATYTYVAQGGAGTYAITATYLGDAVYAGSRGTAVVTVGSTTASGSFTVSAQAVSLAYNGTASGAFTITPAAGYSGTVSLALTYPPGAPKLCYAINPNSLSSNVALPTATAAQSTLLMGEGTACSTSATGAVVLRGGSGHASLAPRDVPRVPARRWPEEGVALAGLLGAGLAFRRARRFPSLLGVGVLASLGLGCCLGLSGCGGGTGSSTPLPPANQPQTLTVTLIGTDSVNSSITSSTTFSLSIQ